MKHVQILWAPERERKREESGLQVGTRQWFVFSIWVFLLCIAVLWTHCSDHLSFSSYGLKKGQKVHPYHSHSHILGVSIIICMTFSLKWTMGIKKEPKKKPKTKSNDKEVKAH